MPPRPSRAGALGRTRTPPDAPPPLCCRPLDDIGEADPVLEREIVLPARRPWEKPGFAQPRIAPLTEPSLGGPRTLVGAGLMPTQIARSPGRSRSSSVSTCLPIQSSVTRWLKRRLLEGADSRLISLIAFSDGCRECNS